MDTSNANNFVMGMAKNALFDLDNFTMINVLRAVLEPIKDAGTGMDSGGCADSADLWITVGGKEYYIQIQKSIAQRAKDQRETATV